MFHVKSRKNRKYIMLLHTEGSLIRTLWVHLIWIHYLWQRTKRPPPLTTWEYVVEIATFIIGRRWPSCGSKDTGTHSSLQPQRHSWKIAVWSFMGEQLTGATSNTAGCLFWDENSVQQLLLSLSFHSLLTHAPRWLDWYVERWQPTQVWLDCLSSC